jgi:methylmalonyl-CoA mutase
MGEEIGTEDFSDEDHRRFAERCREGVAALERVLERPGFGDGPPSTGVEVEIGLVDADARPAPVNREWGLAGNDNPLQGSFIVEELTDLVEAAVLDELDRISERGGVLGAMETGYQRGRIQDESMLYEQRKHDGSLPIVGVNTFVAPEPEDGDAHKTIELRRSDDAEKQDQINRLRDFQARHAAERPAALEELRRAALEGGNTFEALMHAVRHCSLGELTDTLFEVGGRYRRNV